MANYDEDELAKIMTGLSALVPEFSHGPNRDFEDKSKSFPYGFVAQFADEQALQDYANNPTHKALGARLCALCLGGGDGIVVYDLEVLA